MNLRSWTVICLLLLAFSLASRATHLRAIEIEVVGNCTSTTVEVIVTAYVNFLDTNVPFGGDGILDFGDGTSVVVPETAYEVIDAALYVGKARYKVEHSYPAFGSYKITYSETNRNAGIINFAQSVNTPFFTESKISLETGLCNSSPKLLSAPIDKACTGVAFSHNVAAIDVDGDSLSYSLTTPRSAANSEVTDYHLPNYSVFYTQAGIDYQHGNEEQNGTPLFAIDPATGTLTWDAPGAPGEYGLAIKIVEWKRDQTTGAWYESGYVIRDMQIIVQGCSNRRPRIDVPLTLCVIAGTTIAVELPATDPDQDDIVGDAFSEIFIGEAAKARFEPPNGVSQSTSPPHDTASFKIIWETSCADVRIKPYTVVIKISDRPAEGPRLTTFYTLQVKVIAPEPEYESVSVNPLTKEVSLNLKNYPCDNVIAFQVWRRVSEFDYQPNSCDSGMPDFLRYQLREELPPGSINFKDGNLAIGSQYCYRIVALVGDEKAPSRISIDTCFIPKPAEAPVVVNVSVARTHPTNGEILVRWTRPFEIDSNQYPAPYQYKVLRKNVSDPLSEFRAVTEKPLTDTAFTDMHLNTAENRYGYMIELYVPMLTTGPVDTSSEASSVYAQTRSGVGEIKIVWEANTPWYNYSQRHPYHLIYRSDSFDGPFDLIDSVNVNQYDFQYTDRGTYGNAQLTGRPYYYKIMTRGTYGNRKIISPLENFSQITEGKLLDTIPPCAVSPVIRKKDCADFACDGSDYSTTLEWDLLCDDAVAYEVLVKDSESDEYRKIATTTGQTFIHENIASLNKCYRIISLDHAGNKSDSSAVVCNSNCVNFKLPNVITPDVKDGRNDYLTTFSPEQNNQDDCTRSVKTVRLTTFHAGAMRSLRPLCIATQSFSGMGGTLPAKRSRVAFTTTMPM